MLSESQVIKGRWKLVKKIGQGAFGEIYHAKNVITNEDVAIKVERVDSKKQVLKIEVDVLKKLQESPFVCRFISCGRFLEFNYMVMELLGENLSELRRKQADGKFSLLTTLKLGQQMLKAIEAVHAFGYLHRDIKPSNFTMGLGPTKKRSVFLIDFGLARRYILPNGEVRSPRNASGFRGTARYASINSHLSKDLGRCDDLWSLFYVLIEFAKGSLPWRRLKEKDQIGEMKIQHSNPELIQDLPPEFCTWMVHLQGLDYADQPDYGQLQILLRKMYINAGGNDHTPFDWELSFSNPKLNTSREYSVLQRPEVIAVNQNNHHHHHLQPLQVKPNTAFTSSLLNSHLSTLERPRDPQDAHLQPKAINSPRSGAPLASAKKTTQTKTNEQAQKSSQYAYRNEGKYRVSMLFLPTYRSMPNDHSNVNCNDLQVPNERENSKVIAPILQDSSVTMATLRQSYISSNMDTTLPSSPRCSNYKPSIENQPSPIKKKDDCVAVGQGRRRKCSSLPIGFSPRLSKFHAPNPAAKGNIMASEEKPLKNQNSPENQEIIKRSVSGSTTSTDTNSKHSKRAAKPPSTISPLKAQITSVDTSATLELKSVASGIFKESSVFFEAANRPVFEKQREIRRLDLNEKNNMNVIEMTEKPRFSNPNYFNEPPAQILTTEKPTGKVQEKQNLKVQRYQARQQQQQRTQSTHPLPEKQCCKCILQ